MIVIDNHSTKIYLMNNKQKRKKKAYFITVA